MKKLFLACTFLLLTLTVFAQNPDKATTAQKSAYGSDNVMFHSYQKKLEAIRMILIADSISTKDTLMTAVVDSNSYLTPAIDLGGRRLKAIQMPASGWITANLSVLAALNGSTYQSFWVDGSEYVEVVANGMSFAVSPRYWMGIRKFKFQSGTNGAHVNQTGTVAQRTITFIAGYY